MPTGGCGPDAARAGVINAKKDASRKVAASSATSVCGIPVSLEARRGLEGVFKRCCIIPTPVIPVTLTRLSTYNIKTTTLTGERG